MMAWEQLEPARRKKENGEEYGKSFLSESQAEELQKNPAGHL